MIELIKEWAGVAVLVAGSFWGIAEIYFKWRKAGESTKQESQHTEQTRLATDEKALDLDSRRVKASEEVASEALETLAETREENLGLLEDKYNLNKKLIELTHRVDRLEEAYGYTSKYVCFNEDCDIRRPPLGTYKAKCLKEGKNGK